MTIKKHIINYLTHLQNSRILIFYTSDIQNLSKRSEKVFGYRIGSPSTYERKFRQLRKDGKLIVEKKNHKHKRESAWILKGINND